MSAPSTYANSPHDGRVEMEPVDLVENPAEETVGVRSSVILSARYASPCAGCDTGIKPGDPITHGLDGQVEHVDCPEALVVGKHGVCDGCFLEIPASGVCGVCE